jgi:hypothetical protein
MDRTKPDTDVVHPAIETLLTVVLRASDDLRTFHDTVAKANVVAKPPFPRIAVTVTERIIKGLGDVEEDLKKVLTALGLPESSPPV